MPRRRLNCHPAVPCTFLHGIEVDVERFSSELRLRYAIHGEIEKLSLPEPAEARRCDGLWQHTCAEAFLKPRNKTVYYEFNFAPSTRWALYRFSSYRKDRTAVPYYPKPPGMLITVGSQVFEIEARIDLAPLHLIDEPLDLAVSAVIESTEGTLSYWAIQHPSAQPDFHHPEAFGLSL